MKAKLGLAVCVVALVAVPASASAGNPVLTGDVAPNDSFAISLVDASGEKVTHLDTGRYTLNVHDHSEHHNFHLYGAGVDVATDTQAIGDESFTITLGDGTYVFVCDPHASRMKGRFTAGSVTALPTGKLAASISGPSKFALGPLDALWAGPYVISVRDRTAKDGFRLSGPGVTRSTSPRFTGSAKWTVTLAVGKYSYGSARTPKLRGTFTIDG
jgi:plastocyanin